MTLKSLALAGIIIAGSNSAMANRTKKASELSKKTTSERELQLQKVQQFMEKRGELAMFVCGDQLTNNPAIGVNDTIDKMGMASIPDVITNLNRYSYLYNVALMSASLDRETSACTIALDDVMSKSAIALENFRIENKYYIMGQRAKRSILETKEEVSKEIDLAMEAASKEVTEMANTAKRAGNDYVVEPVSGAHQYAVTKTANGIENTVDAAIAAKDATVQFGKDVAQGATDAHQYAVTKTANGIENTVNAGVAAKDATVQFGKDVAQGATDVHQYAVTKTANGIENTVDAAIAAKDATVQFGKDVAQGVTDAHQYAVTKTANGIENTVNAGVAVKEAAVEGTDSVLDSIGNWLINLIDKDEKEDSQK